MEKVLEDHKLTGCVCLVQDRSIEDREGYLFRVGNSFSEAACPNKVFTWGREPLG